MPAARPIRNDPNGEGASAGERFAHGQGKPRLTPLRELQLLDEYRSGGAKAPEALAQLLEGYQRRIYSICYRMVRRPEDAADLTQDVLVKMVENLHGYDGRSKLSTWVIRVAMNAALTHLRKQKLRDHRSLDALRSDSTGPSGGAGSGGESAAPATAASTPWGMPGTGELLPEQHVERNQKRAMVLRALETLDPETRAILVLRDVQDLDYQQLAEVLEVPVGTVKSRLFRARAALREAVESSGEL